MRFGDAVAVEEDRLPGSEDRLLLFVGHVGHEPQRHAPGTQLANSRVAAHVRKIVAGVGVAQPARRRLEDRVEAGDEHVPRDVAVEEAVRTREHRRGRDEARRVTTQDAAGRRHHQRRRHAVPGDVADHERDLAVRELDKVIEVAAHLARRAVVRGDLPALELGQALGKELLLDELRDLKLLLESLASADLGLLLAHELRDPHRRRGLTGELVEKAAVLARVLLVGEPRSELEEPDELSLADERDDELAPPGTERPHRGRIQLELVQAHGTAGLGEVRKERVVRGDVDRRALDRLPPRGRCGALDIGLRRGRRAEADHASQGARPGHHASSFLSAGRPEIVTGERDSATAPDSPSAR